MNFRRRRSWLISLALVFYRLLLLTYPRGFRREWGADMLQVFGDSCRDAARCRGVGGLLGVWLVTLWDWVRSLPRAYIAQLARPRARWRAGTRPAPAGHARVRVEAMRRNDDRFDRFTERARQVLALAQEEAQRFNHNYIGTEHLLLGLIRETDGVGAKVLTNLGVELTKVRSAVEFITGRGDRIVLGEVGLTPRAKQVVQLAVDESRRLHHHYIGTEHLLLGLVREGNGIAAGVLQSLGVSLEQVRTMTIQVLSQSGSARAAATAPSAPRSQPQAEPEPTGAPEPAMAARTMTAGMRRVLALAREEAQLLNHDYIGTEHLLLGLLREPDHVAEQVLVRLNIDRDDARGRVESIAGPGDNIVLGPVDLTPRAQQVIRLAVTEARHLGHEVVGTEHLLLGLMLEGGGIAAGVLAMLGASPERVREQTLRVLAESSATGGQGDQSGSGGADVSDGPPAPDDGPDAGPTSA